MRQKRHPPNQRTIRYFCVVGADGFIWSGGGGGAGARAVVHVSVLTYRQRIRRRRSTTRLNILSS